MGRPFWTAAAILLEVMRNKVNLGSLSRDCSNCDEERKEEKNGAEHPSTWICAASTHSGGSFYEIYKAGGAGAVYC